MAQADELVTVNGMRTTTKIASDTDGASVPEAAAPTQARADKQKAGLVSKDVSGGATWTVTEAEAVNKVLKPTGMDAAFDVVVPDDGFWIVDNSAGSTYDATVKCEGGGGVTVTAGSGAVVVAVGGTASKLDVSG